MAEVKISELPPAVSVSSSAIFPLVQAGQTFGGTIAQAISGASGVIGPASATNNAIPRFDGTTGKLIKNSGITVLDDGTVTFPSNAFISLPGTSTIDGYLFKGRQLFFTGNDGQNFIFFPNAFTNGLYLTDGVVNYVSFDTTNNDVNVLQTLNLSDDIIFKNLSYTTGTISQSGTVITGSGTTFTSAMSGGWFVPSSGSSQLFYFNNSSSGWGGLSQTIGAGTTFVLYYYDGTTSAISTDQSSNINIFTGTRNVSLGSSLTRFISAGSLAARNGIISDTSFPSLPATPTGAPTQTASQSLTTVTGFGTTFTSSMVGQMIIYSTGQQAFITQFNTTTSLAVANSLSVSQCAFYITGTGFAGNNVTVMDGLGNMGVYNAYIKNTLHMPDGAILATSGGNNITLTTTGVTNVTFPTSGTLATTSQIPSGSALTKIDDTNVTLTLGGSATTALLNPASLTLGWTGQLGLTRGGTNASLTASNGGIVYSTASALAILAGTATAGQILQSGASTAPSWSTTTYPATNAINTMMYASAANILSSIAAANNALLNTSSSGVPSMVVPGNLKVVGTNASGVIAGRTLGYAIQSFSTSSTYTPSTGCIYALVYIVGGGGGGGGSSATSGIQYSAGGGGGYGELRVGVFSIVTIGASQSVTIGAAGAQNLGSTGGNGGTSSFGSLINSAGGSGGGVGIGATSTNSSAAGGAGGTGGSLGSYAIPGQSGFPGFTIGASGFNYGGQGASGMFGAGGIARVFTAAGGANASGWGTGGGGAAASPTQSALAGGLGGPGLCIVYELVLT